MNKHKWFVIVFVEWIWMKHIPEFFLYLKFFYSTFNISWFNDETEGKSIRVREIQILCIDLISKMIQNNFIIHLI